MRTISLQLQHGIGSFNDLLFETADKKRNLYLHTYKVLIGAMTVSKYNKNLAWLIDKCISHIDQWIEEQPIWMERDGDSYRNLKC